jgi:hypothetical protein
MSRIHRLITIAGAAVAIAAMGAGPALGATAGQDLRSPDARDGAALSVSTSQDLRSPDARDGATPSTSPSQDLRSADARDVGAPAPTTPVVVEVPARGDSGLNWDSVAIGALMSAGLLFSVGGVLLVTRRRAHVA